MAPSAVATTDAMSSDPLSINPLVQGALDERERLARRPRPPMATLHDTVKVSFEFFPPATPNAQQQLWSAVEQLAPFSPTFVSVTYGAGGTTRERTHATLTRLIEETNLSPAAHLTCVAASKSEVLDVVHSYLASGVSQIVALRGDPQDQSNHFQPHPDGFANAAELVSAIRAESDIPIAVAAYPDVHPEARSAQADLDHLKRKIDAGASRAITQFFFEPDSYLRFLERARAAGISIPIIPGVMPIAHFDRMVGFAKRCGAKIPAWLPQLFDNLDAMPEVRAMVAATVAAELCTTLREHGVNEFHFYTLNKPELTAATCLMLGLRRQAENVLTTPNVLNPTSAITHGKLA